MCFFIHAASHTFTVVETLYQSLHNPCKTEKAGLTSILYSIWKLIQSALQGLRKFLLVRPFSAHLEHCGQEEKQQILLQVRDTHCVKPAYPNTCYSEAYVWSLLLSFFICKVSSKRAEKAIIVQFAGWLVGRVQAGCGLGKVNSACH